jgi:CheY-like chemotaxis protein
VSTVRDGEQVVDLALAEPFDVVLMDLRLPRLDGLTALRRLRGQGYARPIVVLTAWAGAQQKADCLAAGCNAFVAKPVDGDQLIATLRSVAR